MSTAIGFRAYTRIKRPPRELVELFRGIPVATIADNMNRLFCVDTAIKQINGRPLLGPAYTVKVPAGDNLMIHKAISIAEPGDILVIDACSDNQRALVGQIMSTYAKSRGLGGILVDGAVRDVEGLSKLDLPVYARGITPRGPYKNGPGEINVPVSVGGQVVMPGDIVVGDGDGVIVIRPEDAREAAENALARHELEKKILEDIEAGIWRNKWLDKTCEDQGLVILDDYGV